MIRPLLKDRADLFKPADYYSEELYNRMGSLILSRSFHIEEGTSAELQPAVEDNREEEEIDLYDLETDDDHEDVAQVSMVPWADMLNARHGCDNARLFYEEKCLNMCSTKAIKQGEQIVGKGGEPVK